MGDDIEDTVKKKGTRPDRREKQLSRQTTKETVIKCKFKSVLNLDNEDTNKFIDTIQDLVFNYSNRVHASSLLLNLMIREIYHNKNIKDVSLDELPDFTNITFIKQLLNGIKGTRKQIPIIVNHSITNPELFNDIKRINGDRNVYCYGAQLISTNIKNHLILNFPKVLKKYVYNLENVSKSQKEYIIKFLYGQKVDKIKLMRKVKQSKVKKQIDKELEYQKYIINKNKRIQECLDIIKNIKEVLNFKATTTISDTVLKENIKGILRFFVYVNNYIEERRNQIEKEIKFDDNKKPKELENEKDNKENIIKYKKYTKLTLFNILPINRIKTHFITIDKDVLKGIVIESGIKSQAFSTMDDLIKFKNRFNKKEMNLSGTINTDGNVICIHFIKQLPDGIKKQKIVRCKNIQIHENNRVIAFDPGRKNILYGVEEINKDKYPTTPNEIENTRKSVEKDKYKTYKLTRKEYYHKSKIKKCKKKTELWNLNVKEILEKLSLNSPKSVNLDTFKKYLEIVNTNKETLFMEYTKQRWSNQRFTLFCKKRQTIAKFFNTLKTGNDKRTPIIGFGSAKFNSTGKGEVAVPTTSVFKTCKSMFKTNVTNEFRTSKIYYKDETLLNLVGKIVKDRKQAVRGLLWCSSTNTNKFLDRDFNAAVNILNLTRCKTRPTIFCRDVIKRLPKQCFKRIIVDVESK